MRRREFLSFGAGGGGDYEEQLAHELHGFPALVDPPLLPAHYGTNTLATKGRSPVKIYTIHTDNNNNNNSDKVEKVPEKAAERRAKWEARRRVPFSRAALHRVSPRSRARGSVGVSEGGGGWWGGGSWKRRGDHTAPGRTTSLL